MTDSIIKLVIQGSLSDEDIQSILLDICEGEHYSCNLTCPVYRLNGGSPPSTGDFHVNRGCDCFKSGKDMMEFIKNWPTN